MSSPSASSLLQAAHVHTGQLKTLLGIKKTNGAQAHLSSLPPEIQCHITTFISARSDLLSLSLVSKKLYAESFRALHRDVVLPCDNRVIYSWLKDVASDPRRASWVYSLHLVVNQWSFVLMEEDPLEWLGDVGHCLGSLINLTRCV
jgi:hypothetical protein